MPYRIHLEGEKSPGVGPLKLGSHIVLEGPVIERDLQTLEDAKAAMERLIQLGRTNIYAVGWDA